MSEAASAGNVIKADKVQEVSLGDSAPMQRAEIISESIQNSTNNNKGKRDM